jgi:hypothetical protein
MTNEEKVQKYKEEIEAVFNTENALDILNRRDELISIGNTKDLESFDMTTLGRFNKTYHIKIEVKEENSLSSFFMKWMFKNLEIAGITVSEISWDSIKNYGKDDLKQKLTDGLSKMIEEL